jgi:hypothetical protein
MLLDDIASVLDDVALLTKVAIKKTSGVLGDDLALNAYQVAGVSANRELPIVWSVAKGSGVNKLILIPLALLLSSLIPWAITPLLIVGGAYLCFEGCEKILHKLFHSHHSDSHKAEVEAINEINDLSVENLRQIEKRKIRGAIRTDFILSAEITVIALGVVEREPFLSRLLVLSAIGVAMTVGVYGLVAGIVKLDDLGHWLVRFGGFRRSLGRAILALCPYLMKFLSIAGTAAMFLVGGGIVVHKTTMLHHWLDALARLIHGVPHWVVEGVFSAILGIAIGLVVLVAVKALSWIFGKRLKRLHVSNT